MCSFFTVAYEIFFVIFLERFWSHILYETTRLVIHKYHSHIMFL